jgi:hypothetical protein
MANPINKTLLATPVQGWGGKVNAPEPPFINIGEMFLRLGLVN